jgi:hypothetical protein
MTLFKCSRISSQWNEEGIEGIPFKLIIIVLIMAISLPLIWGGLESYDRTQTENDLRNELEFFITRAKQVYFGGTGNADNVEVNFRNSLFTRIEYIKIGDGPEGIWSSIRYKLNHKGVETIVIGNPNIPLAYDDNGNLKSLELGSGRYTIHLECRDDKDFTNDGHNDLYVAVRLV